ncbi:MAG TPA: AAA family ATPase, partial [Vicinamibacterales bacterium]|nr:AAA family ATPase [Vicinamibacterales bacterium]
VFLAGDRAWKMKRAVRYGYLDYSTADRRRVMCEAEVRINRRTAPALYRGVTAVTRQADGRFAIGGSGARVDWLVEMARFDQGGLLDRMAEAGVLPLQLMSPLALTIARFHRCAESVTRHGGWDAMRRVIDGNAAGFAEEGAGILDPATCTSLTTRARFVLDRGGVLLDQRRDDGLVRHCHGDLHLRNIVLLDGLPTLFDAIEFSDEISSVDVLYDLAFLLMDLWRRGLPHHASVLWNDYLSETADLDGLPLMPLFLSCRAAVSAKTTATAARLEVDADRRVKLQSRANRYLAMAVELLEPSPPRLIALGGISGAARSTLAMALAPFTGSPPGAVVIRSDVVRKKLCGVAPPALLGPEGYTEAASRRVSAAVMDQADKVVRSGQTAIADAVFAEESDRDAIEHVARAAGVPFVGLWLDAPEMLSRVEKRSGKASDAEIEVNRQQLACAFDSLRWHRIDAAGGGQHVRDRCRNIIQDVTTPRRKPNRAAITLDPVSESSEESFPASDAPSWTTSTASISASSDG